MTNLPLSSSIATGGSSRRLRRSMLLCALVLAALLTATGVAFAQITQLGHTITTATPSCPTTPCLAVSRTTGFQAKAGSERAMFVAPRDGRIVAWSITLGKPSQKQINFFDANEGGAASAGITVLRPSKRLIYRVVGQSPIVALQPYFGKSADFPLDNSIPVKKGWTVALGVPTWAPALSVGFGNDTSWRASRRKGKCNDTATQTAQSKAGSSTQYYCLYRTARLTYSATLISTP